MDKALLSDLRYFLGRLRRFRRYQVESSTHVIKGSFTNGGSMTINIRIKPKRKTKQGGIKK